MNFVKCILGCLLGYFLGMLVGHFIFGVDIVEWFNGRILLWSLFIASPFVAFFGTVWTILFVVKKVWTSIE